jgi:hypothetical protein
MIVWSLQRMVEKLRIDGIHSGALVMYFIGMMGMLLLGCSVFNFLPTLYYVTFGGIKHYLEAHAAPLPLVIHVFDIWHIWFSLLMTVIVILGIVWCYCTNARGDKKQFIMRFICLNWPLSLRILVVTGMLFAAGMMLLTGWYAPKLRQLAESSEQSETQTKATPLAMFSKIIKKVSVPMLIGKITMVQEAKSLYDQISIISFYIYCLTHLGALLCAIWYFIVMQRCFKTIAS